MGKLALNRALQRVPMGLFYALALFPALVLFTEGLMDALGADPMKTLERELGVWALRFLVAGLCITPLRLLFRINAMRFRRALGLAAFAYALMHLSVYGALDQGFDWPEIWKDILKRPYITIGMSAFALLLPLAVTSNAAAIRALGATWHALHRLVYPAAFLAALHYMLLTKTWQSEPMLYMMVIVLLLMVRLWHRLAHGGR